MKLHAANSAALISDPATHFDMVRPGVAVYGMDPFGVDPAAHGLAPVLSLHSYVATMKRFEPGHERRLRPHLDGRASRPPWSTVPVGYGDGVRRGALQRGARS